MKKFFLMLFSLLIMISVGAVGLPTDNEKTETVSHEKETLSLGFNSVMGLHVDVGKRLLYLSDSTEIVISIDKLRLDKTNLHTARLDKKIDVGRVVSFMEYTKTTTLKTSLDRINKKIDPGIYQGVSL